MMNIPLENQARLLAMLRERHPEFRTLPDETVLYLLEQVIGPSVSENADREKEQTEGERLRKQGRYAEAIEHYKKSLEAAEQQKDEAEQAVAYAALGSLYTDEDTLDLAIAMHEKALDIMQRIGDEPGAARQYGCLAELCRKKGDITRALELFRKSQDAWERIGDPGNATYACFNIGILYRDDIRDPASARSHFEMARALYEMLGDTQNAEKAAQALNSL